MQRLVLNQTSKKHITKGLFENFSLVHSHICYGILAWGNCNVKTLHHTALLHKRAIPTINNAKFKSY